MNKSQIFRYGSLFVLLLPLLLWQGCKECDDPTDPECPNYCVDETNPECPNYDPCTAQTPVSANFRIIENGSWGQIQLFDTVYYDSVRNTSLITDAIHKYPNWTYTWYIGAGMYHGDRTALNYANAPGGTPVYMTLVVEGPPNTTCFPDDDGRDTVTRSIARQVEVFDDTVEYAGYRNGNIADSLFFGFYYDYDAGYGRIKGFFDGCEGSPRNGAGTYKTLIFSDPSIGCNLVRGTIVHDPDKTGDFGKVRCEYSLIPDMSNYPDAQRVNYLFEGRRIR